MLQIFMQWLESFHINICFKDHFVILFLCCGKLHLGEYNYIRNQYITSKYVNNSIT
jgi:hypothetical protein